MRRWLALLLSIGILLTLARLSGFRELSQVWRSIELPKIALASLCYYAAMAVRIASWRILLGKGSPPLLALGPPLILGFILGHVAPAKTGEPTAALLASRTFGLPLARTFSVLTAERALQLLLLLATFLPCASLYAGRILEIERASTLVGTLLVLGSLLLLGTPSLARRLAPFADRLPRFGPVLSEALLSLAAILSSRAKVVPILILGTLYWLLQYVSLWAILLGGGVPVNLAGAAVVAGSAILGGTLSMIPLGTQDGISAVVLAGLGVPLARGFALSLFHTLLSLALGLLALGALAPSLTKRPPRAGGSSPRDGRG